MQRQCCFSCGFVLITSRNTLVSRSGHVLAPWRKVFGAASCQNHPDWIHFRGSNIREARDSGADWSPEPPMPCGICRRFSEAAALASKLQQTGRKRLNEGQPIRGQSRHEQTAKTERTTSKVNRQQQTRAGRTKQSENKKWAKTNKK